MASLPTLITQAKGIALVRVEKVEIIARPLSAPSIWLPNRAVVVSVQHVLRGDPKDSFKAQIESSQWRNPSLREGSIALVFIGGLPAGYQWPNDKGEFVFPAASGFLLLEDLVEPGNLGLGIVAYAALQEVITKRPGVDNGGSWDVQFGDEVAAPLVRMLSSPNVQLRRWVLSKALPVVQITPLFGRALLDGLEDEDPIVASLAARHLMFRRYPPATEPLCDYASRLSREKSELAADIRCYLHGRRLKEAIGEFSDEIARPLKADLARIIGPGTTRVEIEVLIEDDKSIEIKTTSYSLSEKTVSNLKEYFHLAPIPLMDSQAHFVMLLWLEDDQLQLEIDNECM